LIESSTPENRFRLGQGHRYGPGRCSGILEASSRRKKTPQGSLWSSYDAEADVLYINFKKPSQATDSELTDDDVIIRYEGGEIIGVTILHASQR